MEKILSWRKVQETHGTISGISVKKGLVNSLLCNTGKGSQYPNKIDKNKISYYVGSNTQRHGKNALFKSLEKGNAFPVFEKIGSDKWRLLGSYKVRSHKKEGKLYIVFNLTRS
jgi:hypothetical protein